eukprot:747939-Hanusia_phi.AAC.4
MESKILMKVLMNVLQRYLLEKGADPLWSDKYGRSLQELSENAEIWELMRWARNGDNNNWRSSNI